MLISLHSIEYLGSKKVLLIEKCCFYVLACKANFLKFSKYKCWIFSSKDINSKILYVLVYRSLLKRLYNYNVRVGNIYLIDILLNMAFVMYISGRVRLTLSSDEGWNTIFHFPIITFYVIYNTTLVTTKTWDCCLHLRVESVIVS